MDVITERTASIVAGISAPTNQFASSAAEAEISSDDSSIWWPSLKSRSFVLRSVLLDPPQYWRLVPPELQQDPSFVIQFLQAQAELPNATELLPNKDDFERNFTPAIRQNRQVLLAWTRRPDFAILYEQRHLYVPDPWLEDKEIMLAYAAAIPRSLQECADSLRNDRDMVVTSIQRNGLELQYASVQWQQDETIVRMACENHLGALEFCASPALRAHLLQDYEFVQSLLEQCRNDEEGIYIPYAAKLMRSLKEPWRSHPDVLLTALQFRVLSFSDLPIKFQKDHEFVVSALQRRASVYMESAFRSTWKNDRNLLQAAILSPTSTAEIIAAVLNQCPDLTFDLRTENKLIDLRTESKLIEALIVLAPAEFVTKLVTEIRSDICYDRHLMAKAVLRDPALYELSFHPDDPDIVMNALTPSNAATLINSKPIEFRLEHQDIVLRAIVMEDHIMSLQHVVPDAVWAASKPLQQAWLKRHSIWRACFGTTIDRDMALWVAQHVPFEFCRLPLSTEQRSDVDFIKEALVISGGKIWSQMNSAGMPQTIECAVAALAGHPNDSVLRSLMLSFSRVALREHLQKKLADWDSFFLVHCAIALDRGDDGCYLPMLHLGNETGVALRQLMAEFLGMQPILRAVRHYEQAHRYLHSQYDSPFCRSASGTGMTTRASTATTTTTAAATFGRILARAADRPRDELRRWERRRAARFAARAGPRAFFEEFINEMEMDRVVDLRPDLEGVPPGVGALMMDIDDDDDDDVDLDRLDDMFMPHALAQPVLPRVLAPELPPPAPRVEFFASTAQLGPLPPVQEPIYNRFPAVAAFPFMLGPTAQLDPLPPAGAPAQNNIPLPAVAPPPNNVGEFADGRRVEDDRRRRIGGMFDEARRVRRIRRWF